MSDRRALKVKTIKNKSLVQIQRPLVLKFASVLQYTHPTSKQRLTRKCPSNRASYGLAGLCRTNIPIDVWRAPAAPKACPQDAEVGSLVECSTRRARRAHRLRLRGPNQTRFVFKVVGGGQEDPQKRSCPWILLTNPLLRFLVHVLCTPTRACTVNELVSSTAEGA